MIYKEEIRDLFSVPDDYYFAHCISADFAMGKGIAVEFNKRFNMRDKLTIKYIDWKRYWDNSYECRGDCILEGKVFNLITKRNYWDKPTYRTITLSLQKMKILCINNNVKRLAMPVIGCGLDRLEWEKVSSIIKQIFEDIDIEILICRWR